MHLQQLRHFCKIAKQGSISRAAEELYVSQPALSKTIKNLEHELGFPLFTRNGKSIVLNENGKLYLERIEKGLSSIDDAKKEVLELNDRPVEEVTVSVYASSLSFSNILLRHMSQNPNTKFNLYILLSDKPNYSRSCDMYIVSTPVAPKGMAVHPLITEEMVLVVPKGHFLDGRETVELREAAECNFVTGIHGATRASTKTFCNFAGFEPKITFQTNDIYVLREVVREGLGVALVPKITWASVISDKTHVIRVTNPICQRTLLLVTWPDRYLSHAAVNLKDMIIQSFEEAGKTGVLR
jgi:DNA-binding transcriptional LysR family regulator